MDTKKDIIQHNAIENQDGSTQKGSEFSVEDKGRNSKITTLLNRTQKIVTAIYMVTECIDDGEPIKNSLRTSSLELLKLITLTDNKTSLRTHFDMETSEITIRELLSLLEISQVVGITGSMNSGILMKELTKLSSDIAQIKMQNSKSSFTMQTLRSQGLEGADFLKNFSFNSDDSLGGENGATDTSGDILKMFLSNKSNGQGHAPLASTPIYKGQHPVNNIKDIISGQSKKIDLAIKNERRNSILLALKDKDFVTVKDIASIVKNCSEKTLQRELTQLVKDKVLKKTGEKRWSRYSLV